MGVTYMTNVFKQKKIFKMANDLKYVLDNVNDKSDKKSIKFIKVKYLHNSSQESKYTSLNLTDDLSNIRRELEQNEKYDILLFLKKYLENSNHDESYEFCEIAFEDEECISLNEIVDNNILFIKCKIKINWKILNSLRKLDYGR